MYPEFKNGYVKGGEMDCREMRGLLWLSRQAGSALGTVGLFTGHIWVYQLGHRCSTCRNRLVLLNRPHSSRAPWGWFACCVTLTKHVPLSVSRLWWAWTLLSLSKNMDCLSMLYSTQEASLYIKSASEYQTHTPQHSLCKWHWPQWWCCSVVSITRSCF